MENHHKRFDHPCVQQQHVICGGVQEVDPRQWMSQMYEHFVHRDCSRLIVFPLDRSA